MSEVTATIVDGQRVVTMMADLDAIAAEKPSWNFSCWKEYVMDRRGGWITTEEQIGYGYWLLRTGRVEEDLYGASAALKATRKRWLSPEVDWNEWTWRGAENETRKRALKAIRDALKAEIDRIQDQAMTWAHSPDPGERLWAARCPITPNNLIQMLKADEDPDVVEAAEMTEFMRMVPAI